MRSLPHVRSNSPILNSHTNNDRRLSTKLIADELGLSQTTLGSIATENLMMRKVCVKLVPKVLSVDQKKRRMTVCQEMIQRLNVDPNFLEKVFTGDETWFYEYDTESKLQSSEWHTSSLPKPKKARMSKSRVKCMLIVFLC
ncbi:uncharacterized protein LOC118185707 [Stegodyphus dumicola]|uniref:uncharacterized protein LOC118185707 n=1 Tax=Stegodyphus dumicola TaxID=202533 RepID=UPI0015ABB550|nr:uncharacterized protein LOC118185707 [Stegodyphus dumicola]